MFKKRKMEEQLDMMEQELYTLEEKVRTLDDRSTCKRRLIIEEYENGFMLLDEVDQQADSFLVIKDGSRASTYSRLLYEVAERFGCNRDEKRADNLNITFDARGREVKE